MRKLIFKILLCIFIINIISISVFFTFPSYGALEEIDPKFGRAPTIDGQINSIENEWKDASNIETNLTDLPVELWVMESGAKLYIAVQIELSGVVNRTTEFVGIIISNSSSEDIKDFVDAKIIQFSDIYNDEFDYFDYVINNSIFVIDSIPNGNGAAKLNGETGTYEFSIPIDNPQGVEEDVYLNYDDSFAFNITYGNTPIYPEGIEKSSIFLINIKKPPKVELGFWKLTAYIFLIIIFSFIGILYGFYIYKIFKLKATMERYRR
ncbi:MAG: hypothetical protein ACFE9T_15960 [Promethearchaeota archaeon]